MAIISCPSQPVGKSSHLGCRAGGLEVRSEKDGGRDRGTGYKGMSFNGQTLDWHDRSQFSGAKLVYDLLSVGTQERPPNLKHLVDDFQRKNFVYVCDSMEYKNSYMCLCECQNCVCTVYANVLCVFSMCVCLRVCVLPVCQLHLCVCVRLQKRRGWGGGFI